MTSLKLYLNNGSSALIRLPEPKTFFPAHFLQHLVSDVVRSDVPFRHRTRFHFFNGLQVFLFQHVRLRLNYLAVLQAPLFRSITILLREKWFLFGIIIHNNHHYINIQILRSSANDVALYRGHIVSTISGCNSYFIFINVSEKCVTSLPDKFESNDLSKFYLAVGATGRRITSTFPPVVEVLFVKVGYLIVPKSCKKMCLSSWW